MKWGNWIIAACCTIFVAVIVTPTGVYEGVWKLMTGKDAAAWVQAFGSIIAIFISVFGVMILQDRERRKAAQQARLEWLQALSGVATSCHDLIVNQHDLTTRFPTGDEFRQSARPNRLSTVDAAIRAVTLDKAHPEALAMAIITLQHVTGKTLREIDRFKDVSGSDRIVLDLSDCAKRSSESVATIRGALIKTSNDLRRIW